ncbi:hypothetical protein GCM10010885_19530 [Alicyclobacillus cellulosilyticus]|uniref:Uncharacterized protein n=1 Tax=Alicyclobacillus cellulosilyticus TaxID=1003997 RepID=A0A917KFV2_9BACL|nr:hypothetical protein [Alicyclobacillus cellulosilyticus]GGJ10410.1 hypothetical protein GCM10010885_19530 [Alicyclobacillus cellulosilyticus]
MFRDKVVHTSPILRELLVLEHIERQLHRRRRELKQQLAAAGVRVVEREDTDIDTMIRYVERGWERQAVYMRPMLDAEAEGRLRKVGLGRR